MTDPEVLNEEERYAKALEEQGLLEPEAAPPAADTPADPPAPAIEEPQPALVAAADPPQSEPFPGFATLTPEAQKLVLDRLAAADEAEKLREQNRTLDREYRAAVGRVAPTQQKMEQIQREREELIRRVNEFESHKTQSQRDGLAASIEKFKQQYPDEAGVFDGIAEQMRSQESTFQKRTTELEQQLQQVRGYMEHNRITSELTQRHPDWREIDSSDTFHTWIEHSGPTTRNMKASRDPEVLSELFDNYKRDLALAQLLNGQTAQPTPAPTPAKPLSAADVDPTPIVKKTTGASRLGTAASSEEDQYVAGLLQAGIPV